MTLALAPADLYSGAQNAEWACLGIDFCTHGWIHGITNTPHPDNPKALLSGLKALGELAEETGIPYVRWTYADLELQKKTGFALLGRAAKLTRTEKAWGPRSADYLSKNGIRFDLWELVRGEVAWALRDARASLGLHVTQKEEVFVEQTLSACYMNACSLIEAFDVWFSSSEIRRSRAPWGGRPPVFLEGGLHLGTRVMAEIARGHGHPVYALENTFLPDFMVFTPESGAAVNRIGLLSSRARHRRPSEGSLESTQRLVGEELEKKADLRWYREAYPWLYSDDPDPELEESERRRLNEVLRDARDRNAFTVLFLGQVPYDCSVTVDNPEGWDAVHALHAYSLLDPTRPLVFIYRSHPMEEQSRLDKKITAARLHAMVSHLEAEAGDLAFSAREITVHVIDGGHLPLAEHFNLDPQRERWASCPDVVATLNSQAGFELARYEPVAVLAPAFYEAAGVTYRGPQNPRIAERCGRMTDQVRERRWLAYVRWLIDRVYMRRSTFDAQSLRSALERHARDGIFAWDPDVTF